VVRAQWLAVVLVIALVPGVSGAADAAAPPLDYTTVADQLSQPQYGDTLTEQVRLPMADGVEILVEITRPDPASYPDVRVPVILSASPYHISLDDRKGQGEMDLPEDDDGVSLGLTGYFPQRGYAVAAMDLRGTGDSGGCLDHLGPRDRSDLAEVIGWLGSQPWSTGRVGMIGLSYPGFAAANGVATGAAALKTAVIISGGASMYDHQFQHGVPYFLQYAGPIAGYPALTSTRYAGGVTGVSYFLFGGEGTVPPSQQYAYAHCAGLQSAATAGAGQVTGQYEQWHADRDVRDEVATADIPLFMVHGIDDHQIRMPAAEWYFDRRFARADDKVWIGPWPHAAGNTRGLQWTYALHAWFDRHLQQGVVDTGPSVEAFFDTGDVATAEAWTAAEGAVTLFPDASDMRLGLEPPASDAVATFTGRGNIEGPNEVAGGPSHDDGGIEFRTDPLAEDFVVLGLPHLRLDASVTGEVVHLVATLWREDTGGARRLLDACAIQPQLRDGIETLTPVVPGSRMELTPQCFTAAHHLQQGDRLVLRVGTGSEHHFTPFSADAQITVHTGPEATSYTLPVRDLATFPDFLAAEG
jgi:predicted acyl esterase